MRASGLVLIWIAFWILRISSAQEDDCLLASNGNRPLPRFVRGEGDDDDTLEMNPVQAIITSYQFNCCGVITEWRAFVERNGETFFREKPYNISFQVWRPNSPSPVDTDGCYTMAGVNYFPSIPLADPNTADRGIVTGRPPESERIEVQPGDVVGFYLINNIVRNRPNAGIMFTEEFASQRVWYGSGETTASPNCPFPVGSQRQLSRSTNLAPLITATISQMACPVSSTTVPVQTPVALEPTSPPQSGSNDDNTGLILGIVMVLVLIIALVVLTIATVLIVAKKKRGKQKASTDKRQYKSVKQILTLTTNKLKEGKESFRRPTDVVHSKEHIYHNPKTLNQDYYFSEGLAEAVDMSMTANESYGATTAKL